VKLGGPRPLSRSTDAFRPSAASGHDDVRCWDHPEPPPRPSRVPRARCQVPLPAHSLHTWCPPESADVMGRKSRTKSKVKWPRIGRIGPTGSIEALDEAFAEVAIGVVGQLNSRAARTWPSGAGRSATGNTPAMVSSSTEMSGPSTICYSRADCWGSMSMSIVMTLRSSSNSVVHSCG
jgi:hypothetical protein